MKYVMPYGKTMEVKSSEEIDEDEIGMDEKLDGVVYHIVWDNIRLPWTAETRLHAHAIALGCQYGAMQMYKKNYD